VPDGEQVLVGPRADHARAKSRPHRRIKGRMAA
jgi:hypothetical protein